MKMTKKMNLTTKCCVKHRLLVGIHNTTQELKSDSIDIVWGGRWGLGDMSPAWQFFGNRGRQKNVGISF